MSGPSVKIPADWLDSDQIEDLGADAILLMLTALGNSARQLTEGVVPRRALRKLWPVDDIDDAVTRLIKAGEVEDQGDTLLFVHWQKFILDKSEVEAIKEKNRVRDERRRRHNGSDHSMCLPRYCKDAPRENSRENSRESHVSPRVSHADPTRTYPDRPLGREGKGRGAGSAADDSASATPPGYATAEKAARNGGRPIGALPPGIVPRVIVIDDEED